MKWTPLRQGGGGWGQRCSTLAAIYKVNPTSTETHVIERSVGTRFVPAVKVRTFKLRGTGVLHQHSPTSWRYLAGLISLSFPGLWKEFSFSRRRRGGGGGGGVVIWSDPLSHALGAFSSSAWSIVGPHILVYVLFHLHSRYESSPLPPSQPL